MDLLDWGVAMAQIRVLIIQPNHLFRDTLAFYVRSQEQTLSVVASAAEAGEILDSLCSLQPDVILIEFRLPGREGLNEARLLRRDFAQARILMTGVTELDSDVMACIEAGASGCLLKDASLEDLHRNIQAVAAGDALISPKMAGHLFSRVRESAEERERLRGFDLVRLTHREREIIPLIEKGLSNKEIAVCLSIEVQTVKNHVHNILEKLQLDGRREAARYAVENGLLMPAG